MKQVHTSFLNKYWNAIPQFYKSQHTHTSKNVYICATKIKIKIMFRVIVFLSGSFFVFISVCSMAQNLIFLDAQENNINGQTITFTDGNLNTTHTVHLKTKNISGSYMNVKLTRYELNVIPNTQNYFCWANCYAPEDAGAKPVWTDPFNVGMVADSVYEKFSAYYTPNGISGVSSFRYVLFDANNPDDSSFVDIVFDISVGLKKLQFSSTEFLIYPNPSSDFIEIILPKRENKISTIIITNILGEMVRMENLFCENGKNISVKDLEQGIYFCSFLSDYKMIGTKKITVLH